MKLILNIILTAVLLTGILSAADVTADQARKAALQRVPGTVVKEEYERKKGRSVYEFYIRAKDGRVYEVYVDASSGEVVKVESRD